MRRNIIETVMGAVVLLVAGAFVIFAFQTSDLRTASGYEVTANFSNASGLAPGTDVRLAGVKIGSVVDQSLDPVRYVAVVRMSIDDSVELPTDSSVRIIPDGLLGGNFLEVTPGGEEGMIAPGGVIRFTQGSVNVVDLIGRFVFSAADSESPAQ